MEAFVMIFIAVTFFCICFGLTFVKSSEPDNIISVEDSENQNLLNMLLEIFNSGDTYNEYANKHDFENGYVLSKYIEEQIELVTNENDKEKLYALHDELSVRGMFLTTGKGLIMNPKEKCYFRCVNTITYTIQTLIKHINYSGFRCGRNMFRMGNVFVTQHDTRGWKEYLRGTMYITNQRVIIIGLDSRTKNIPLGQIANYSLFENNGVLFTLKNGNPIIFKFPFNGVMDKTESGMYFEDSFIPCLIALDKVFEERQK